MIGARKARVDRFVDARPSFTERSVTLAGGSFDGSGARGTVCRILRSAAGAGHDESRPKPEASRRACHMRRHLCAGR